MAAAPGLLFWLLLLGPPWRVPGHPEPDANRRFSEHKLCADDECSMLMYRGEALEDFTGPDCRFVNFKKGDHVYVYYKLAGGAPEVWAGTVGRNFGYFPKDFIRVAHEYIEEELKVPADETDFVCFDGGKDDFDNYNIEELLGFLKLPESATGDSGKAIEKTSQHVENPEVSEESDLDPAEANTEESESELSENTEELEERHASPKNPPHVNRRTDDPQGESSFDHFEEMLQEKLKVPESQNNKTSNSSQVANEQEQIDAYKLLKKEMTLDLKTKFGSTADALVSDDETTRLVTSLEDDFDEDLDDEYYIVGKEEEDQESFDELPLLTFTDEDLETPLESGAEKHSPDKEQNSSEEDKAEVAQPPGVRHDATVTESEQISVDLENSSSEAEGSDDAFVPDGEWGEPQLAADYVESEKAEDGLLIVHGLETNEDKDPEVDAELGSKGKGRTGEGSQTDLPRSEKGPEDEKQEGGTPRGSAQSRDLDSLPAPGKDRAALTSTFGNKEGDLKGTVVSVSKETLHEEKLGEQLLEGGSDSGSERKAAGDPMKGERLRQESLGVAAPAPSGDDRHNASSQDPVEEEADVSVNGPEPQVLSEERQNEDPRTHNQPRSSSPGEVAGSRALGAQGTALGGSPAGHQARDVAAAEDRRASESSGLSAQRGAEAPGAPAPIPQAEGDDGDDGDDDDDGGGGGGGRGPAGLLEDENAASARRAGAEGRPRGPGGGDVEAGAGGDPGPGAGPRADPAAPRPADGEERRTLELGGALRGAQSGDRARRGPEGRPAPAPARAPAPSGLAQRPGGAGADLPIIRSFAKEEQALRRLQRLLDVRALEAMLQEMARRLRAAPRDSAPRGADTARDTAFRAAESQILRAAQAMLAARVDGRGGLGTEDSSAEAAAVLDDVQDLIYFVGYTHAAGEDTVPLAAAQPPEAEEVQPPLEENFPLENTDDLQMQNPEGFGPLDQPTTGDMNVSDASEKPNTEEAVDPGIVTTDSSPVDAADGKKQRVTNADEPASVTPLENAILLIYSSMYYLTKTLVATLPDDVQPGPDFYGLPWKPVLITAFLGIVSFVIFFWRTILVVKNRVYQVTEQQISEKLKNITKENAELVQKLSDYEQKIKESKKHVQETKKQNMILSDEAIKFKDKIRKLEETNESLNDTAKSLRVMLDSERDQNAKNQDLILENKKSLEKLKDVIAMNSSELSEVQIALNEAKLSEEKVKSECHRVQEENTRLKKKKEQLQQEIKDWSKSHAELSEQIRSFETCQKDLEVALTHKDDSVNALTNCITQLNRLDCESESEGQNKGGNESDELANGEVGGDRSEKMKNQIKQMMDISRTQTAISVVEEDLRLLQLKLRASMSTKCNLEDQIKKLEDDRDSLQSAKAGLEDECRTLRQKVEILNELYQQKEMALQKKLSQEEYERQEREQRLSAADEKAVLAAEEVKTYKRRIEEMEDELQKTERAFKSQIATHEKKAHDNWLKARAAERAIAEEKREAANLRHKLLELTQKMAMLQEEPVIVKPMPGRPSAQNPPRRGPLSQNGSFGPSPVSGGECSPPPDPPVRPPSATLGRGDVPRRDLGSADGSLPRPRWSSEASGKPAASEPASGATPMTNSSSRSSSPSKVMDEGKQTALHEPEGPSVPSIPSLAEHPVAVNVAAKGPPPFPGVPLLSSPVGGPLLPPIRYGPPPQLCGPFGPRPLPPPFGPGFRPPLGLREYAPGVPPGTRDLPLDPREFLPGHTHFRPPGSHGPREYFFPGTRLPAPAHSPQEYPPPPATRDAPPPAPPSRSQDSSPALKQSP